MSFALSCPWLFQLSEQKKLFGVNILCLDVYAQTMIISDSVLQLQLVDTAFRLFCYSADVVSRQKYAHCAPRSSPNIQVMVILHTVLNHMMLSFTHTCVLLIVASPGCLTFTAQNYLCALGLLNYVRNQDHNYFGQY